MATVNNETIVQAPSVPQSPRGVVVDEWFSYFTTTALGAGGSAIAQGPGVVGIVTVVAAAAGAVLKLSDALAGSNPVMFQVALPDTAVYTFSLFMRFTTGLIISSATQNCSYANVSYRQ